LKTLYFVAHLADIPVLLRQAQQEKEAQSVWVAADGAMARALQARGVESKTFEAMDAGEGEIRRLALEWLDDWADEPLFDGLSIKAFARCREVTMWSFALPVLFPDVLRCIQMIKATGRVLDVVQPDRVVLVDVRRLPPHPFRLNLDANIPGKIIAETCQARRCRIDWVQPGRKAVWDLARQRLKARILGWAYHSGGRWFLGRCRAWSSRTKLKRGDSPKGKNSPCVMVLSSPVYWRECLADDGKWHFDDAIVGRCADQWEALGCRVVGLDFELNTPNLRQFGVLRQKRRRQRIEWKAYECYAAGMDRTALRRDRSEARRLLERIKAAMVGRRLMEYQGVVLDSFLAHRLRYVFARAVPEALEYWRAIEAAIKTESPDLMVSVYEEGPYGRAATLAGRASDVPTMALQHGILSSPYVPAYYYSQVSSAQNPDPDQVPVPDCTAVYGEQTHKWLTQLSAYPADGVTVVGMPSADAAVRAQEHLSKEETCRNLGLDAERPLVLLVSQPFLNRENRTYFVDALLRTAASMPETQFLVKLHPSDAADVWDADLAAHGLSGRVKVSAGRLLELIHASDVLVSWYSTVILEAAVCRRPVIVLKVPGCWGPEDLVEDGLATAVEGSEALALALKRQLAAPQAPQAKGLDAHVYCPDGNAARRAAEVGLDLIRAGNTSGKGRASVRTFS
jgi:hypothetical protein